MLKSLSYQPNHISKESTGKAWFGHIPFAHWLISVLRPGIFVELGTHHGASYFSFCDSVVHHNLSTQCHAVDSWQGDAQAGLYGNSVFEEVCDINNKKYSQFSSLHRCMFDDALDYFEDSSIDLLHIDGFHSFEAVSHDYATWLPKLSQNAVILFHDTQVFKEGFGVNQLWSAIRSQNPASCFEFVHSFGLGIFCLGEVENIYGKFASKEISQEEFRVLFEIAGNEIIRQNEVPQPKTVTPNEVVALVKQLASQSIAYKKEIIKIVA